MQRMRSPTPNRKGVFEEHMVPSRRVGGLQERGWTLVDANQTHTLPDAEDGPQTLYARHKGGPWYRVTDESGAVIAESVKRGDAEDMGAVVVAK